MLNKDNLFPYLIILSMIAGLIFAVAINRFDFLVRGLSVAIPGFLAAFFLLKIRKRDFDLKNSIIIYNLNQRTLILLFCILFTISICILLITPYRPWYYFVVISALYVLVFIQIFSKNFKFNIILVELVFILINLIYGITLKYPLFYAGTDTIGHIFLSEVTYLSGHVIPQDLSISYNYFPLYHILIAESSHLLGLDIKTSLFVVTCISFVITIIFIYYMFNQIVQNKQISLLVCLLYSTSSVVIYHGFYMVTRTMAFVGFIILLYLLYKSAAGNKIIYTVLTILMAVFLILVHQVSMPQIVLLLFILLVCEWFVSDKKYLGHNFFALLCVMFISYWLYTAWLFSEYLIQTYSVPIYFEKVIPNPVRHQNEIGFLLNSIDMSIFVFFALIGIGYLLWKRKPKYASVFGLFALLTLVLYIPNPLQTLWQTMILFRFDRFMLLISPFMAFVMGWGVFAFYNYLLKKNTSKKICSIIIILLVAGFVVTSLTSQNCVSDCEYFKNMPGRDYPRQYFNHEELHGFKFIFDYIPYGSELYSDYFTQRYFIQIKFSKSDELNLPFYESKIYCIEDSSNCNGYILIRDKEFSNIGLHLGSDTFHPLYTPTDENKQQLYHHLQKNHMIYSNYAIDIYYYMEGVKHEHLPTLHI